MLGQILARSVSDTPPSSSWTASRSPPPAPLRGAGNTHTGLFFHLCGYWVIGMPVGILLFHYKLGAVGLWRGIYLGLIIAGGALITSWHRTARKIETSMTSE